MCNGLVTVCPVRRLLVPHSCTPSFFFFFRACFRWELKLGSLVRALGKLPGGIGRFLPCADGRHLSRPRHLGWEQCSHGLTCRPLESCHPQCLKAVCRVWGVSGGCRCGAFDGSLKLRHCTTPPPGIFQGWVAFYLVVQQVKEVDMRRLISWTRVAVVQKRVWLSSKTCRGYPVSKSGRIQGFHRQSDGKCCTLTNPLDKEVRSACLSTFFLALGLVHFAAGEAWNLHPERTGVGFFRLASPAEGNSALAQVR